MNESLEPLTEPAHTYVRPVRDPSCFAPLGRRLP